MIMTTKDSSKDQAEETVAAVEADGEPPDEPLHGVWIKWPRGLPMKLPTDHRKATE